MFIGIFHIFNMASTLAANGHVTILLLLIQMTGLYISDILCKFHSNRLSGSGDTLCLSHIPSIFFQVLENDWH